MFLRPKAGFWVSKMIFNEKVLRIRKVHLSKIDKEVMFHNTMLKAGIC